MSNTGRCKDCEYSRPVPRADDCKAKTKAGLPLLICGHDKMKVGYGRIIVDEDGLITEDDAGWGFRVGPLFGCIHFEPKSSFG